MWARTTYPALRIQTHNQYKHSTHKHFGVSERHGCARNRCIKHSKTGGWKLTSCWVHARRREGPRKQPGISITAQAFLRSGALRPKQTFETWFLQLTLACSCGRHRFPSSSVSMRTTLNQFGVTLLNQAQTFCLNSRSVVASTNSIHKPEVSTRFQRKAEHRKMRHAKQTFL